MKSLFHQNRASDSLKKSFWLIERKSRLHWKKTSDSSKQNPCPVGRKRWFNFVSRTFFCIIRKRNCLRAILFLSQAHMFLSAISLQLGHSWWIFPPAQGRSPLESFHEDSYNEGRYRTIGNALYSLPRSSNWWNVPQGKGCFVRQHDFRKQTTAYSPRAPRLFRALYTRALLSL